VKVIPTPVEELPELEELYRQHVIRPEAV